MGWLSCTSRRSKTSTKALGSAGSRDYDPTKEIAAKAREDVDNFLAVEERPRFIGEEIVQKDEVDADTDRLYKHSAFLVRQDGMTHEEFVDYWQNNHTPIAREIEGVVKQHRPAGRPRERRVRRRRGAVLRGSLEAVRRARQRRLPGLRPEQGQGQGGPRGRRQLPRHRRAPAVHRPGTARQGRHLSMPDYETQVREAFPELDAIDDDDLREQVVSAWVRALDRGGWRHVEDIPYAWNIHEVTNVEHVRGVTRIARESAKTTARLPRCRPRHGRRRGRVSPPRRREVLRVR